jgi:hypothetical protein
MFLVRTQPVLVGLLGQGNSKHLLSFYLSKQTTVLMPSS